MHTDEKLVNRVGPGGYKCPPPKERQKWRRLIRRRLKALYQKRMTEFNSKP